MGNDLLRWRPSGSCLPPLLLLRQVFRWTRLDKGPQNRSIVTILMDTLLCCACRFTQCMQGVLAAEEEGERRQLMMNLVCLFAVNVGCQSCIDDTWRMSPSVIRLSHTLKSGAYLVKGSTDVVKLLLKNQLKFWTFKIQDGGRQPSSNKKSPYPSNGLADWDDLWQNGYLNSIYCKKSDFKNQRWRTAALLKTDKLS